MLNEVSNYLGLGANLFFFICGITAVIKLPGALHSWVLAKAQRELAQKEAMEKVKEVEGKIEGIEEHLKKQDEEFRELKREVNALLPNHQE